VARGLSTADDPKMVGFNHEIVPFLSPNLLESRYLFVWIRVPFEKTL